MAVNKRTVGPAKGGGWEVKGGSKTNATKTQQAGIERWPGASSTRPVAASCSSRAATERSATRTPSGVATQKRRRADLVDSLEVGGIDPADFVAPRVANADPVVVHQPSERLPVEQNDPSADPLGVLSGFLREPRSGDEDALRGALALEAAGERLEIRPTNCVIGRPPLGLDVDRVEPELVLVDHAVDAVVAGPANVSRRILCLRAAVAHRYQKVEDELLEERRTRPEYVIEEVRLDGPSKRRVGDVEQLLGILRRDLWLDGLAGCRRPHVERDELRVLLEEHDIDTLRRLREHGSAAISNSDRASDRSRQEACLDEVRCRPVRPVVDDPLIGGEALVPVLL